ncbi:hypothetical protein ACRAWD_31330 [Caulobacter segnis]
MSGVPNWTTDIGGFSVEDRYLNREPKHWPGVAGAEPAVSVPVRQPSRRCSASHGEEPFREIWNLADEGPRPTSRWSGTTGCATA